MKDVIDFKQINSIIKCFDGLFLCSIEDHEDSNNSMIKYKYKKYKNKGFQKKLNERKNLIRFN